MKSSFAVFLSLQLLLAASRQPPNILFLLVDDLGHFNGASCAVDVGLDWIGCFFACPSSGCLSFCILPYVLTALMPWIHCCLCFGQLASLATQTQQRQQSTSLQGSSSSPLPFCLQSLPCSPAPSSSQYHQRVSDPGASLCLQVLLSHAVLRSSFLLLSPAHHHAHAPVNARALCMQLKLSEVACCCPISVC